MYRVTTGRVDQSNIFDICILLTVHLGTIFVDNQLDAQFFMYIYFCFLHVSGKHVLIRRIYCTNTTSGICHSV